MGPLLNRYPFLGEYLVRQRDFLAKKWKSIVYNFLYLVLYFDEAFYDVICIKRQRSGTVIAREAAIYYLRIF
jgi:hypothetical protein